MEFAIGDWIILDKSKLANDIIFDVESNKNILGKIKDVNIKAELYTIDFGKKNGFFSKEEEMWITIQYRKATPNEIKKGKIKRMFVK
jgi:hypothetical protein